TQVNGVNGAGLIVGSYTDAGGVEHGFLDNGGVYTSIDYPGSVDTQAIGINDAGLIVGSYVDSSLMTHGLVDKGGSLSTKDYPGASGTCACGVNNQGYISGSFYDGTTDHGFIMTRESATAMLAFPALLGL